MRRTPRGMSREHNNANVLCIGARVVGESLAVEIVRTWLSTPWSGGARHARRLQLIAEAEERGVRDPVRCNNGT